MSPRTSSWTPCRCLTAVQDEAVREELAAMRPAAPELSPEDGYYTEYIEVSADGGGNDVYLSIDGEYPSMEKDLYTEPVTLPAGENSVLAIAVDENSMVSTAVQRGYTIGGVVEAVTLTDPAVDSAVREALGITSADTLMTDMLWSLPSLTLPDTVRDLSDLAYMTGLRSLTIQNVSGLDFSVLSQLTELTELDLSGCNHLHRIPQRHRPASPTSPGCGSTSVPSRISALSRPSPTSRSFSSRTIPLPRWACCR